jgi:glycosyltransferase involved in cell wall biosynthesis
VENKREQPEVCDERRTGARSNGLKTFTVLIPALNEGKNIGQLLDDVYAQELDGSLTLTRVMVISDGSTDNTEEVVRERAGRYEMLELRVNPKREGKAVCINEGKRGLDCDYFVLVDGDVRLNGKNTLNNLLRDLDEDVGMVGGLPVPVEDRSGLAPMIFLCGDILRDYIRRRLNDGSNIYGAHGRILALSRELYAKIEIPSLEQGSRVLSTDQFLYYSCITHGMRFVLRHDAEVLFKLPESFKDYLLVTVRFMYSAKNTMHFFHDESFTNQFHVPMALKVKAMLHLAWCKPLGVPAWISYRALARAIYLFKRYVRREEVGATWEISESTKDAIESPGP